MCEQNSCCQKPENLEGRPEACSPEQIRICHGETAEHLCACQEQKDG